MLYGAFVCVYFLGGLLHARTHHLTHTRIHTHTHTDVHTRTYTSHPLVPRAALCEEEGDEQGRDGGYQCAVSDKRKESNSGAASGQTQMRAERVREETYVVDARAEVGQWVDVLCNAWCVLAAAGTYGGQEEGDRDREEEGGWGNGGGAGRCVGADGWSRWEAGAKRRQKEVALQETLGCLMHILRSMCGLSCALRRLFGVHGCAFGWCASMATHEIDASCATRAHTRSCVPAVPEVLVC
jgi:hypothetical protein